MSAPAVLAWVELSILLHKLKELISTDKVPPCPHSLEYVVMFPSSTKDPPPMQAQKERRFLPHKFRIILKVQLIINLLLNSGGKYVISHYFLFSIFYFPVATSGRNTYPPVPVAVHGATSSPPPCPNPWRWLLPTSLPPPPRSRPQEASTSSAPSSPSHPPRGGPGRRAPPLRPRPPRCDGGPASPSSPPSSRRRPGPRRRSRKSCSRRLRLSIEAPTPRPTTKKGSIRSFPILYCLL